MPTVDHTDEDEPMTEQHDANVDNTDDEEYGEAYGFWVFAIGIAGAVGGYVGGSALGFTFWPSLGFALAGLIVCGSIAYRFRRIVAIVSAVLIVIAIIAAVVEGILTA